MHKCQWIKAVSISLVLLLTMGQTSVLARSRPTGGDTTTSTVAKPPKDGWFQQGASWYYYQDGKKVEGWFKDPSGSWYYFTPKTGKMHTGWYPADSEDWYYLSPINGIMQNGWIRDGGNDYYLKSNGVMSRDRLQDGRMIESNGVASSINSNNVVLSNSKSKLYREFVHNNAYVASGTLGSVEIIDSDIKGKLIIQGGNRVVIEDSNINTIVIDKSSGDVEIVLDRKTTVRNVIIKSGATMLEKRYNTPNIDSIVLSKEIPITHRVDIEAEANEVIVKTRAEVNINKGVDKVEIRVPGIVYFNSDVLSVVITKEAAGATLRLSDGVRLEKVAASGGALIRGQGVVVLLESYTDGLEVDAVIVEVVVGRGGKPPVAIGGGSINTPDKEIVIDDVTVSGLTEIYVDFRNPVYRLKASDFQISPSVKIRDVEESSDGRSYILTVDEMVEKTEYTISISAKSGGAVSAKFSTR